MNEDLLKKLGARGELYPHRLEAGFPHVLARLAALWGTPELDRYFASLLLVDDIPRAGFPLEVAAEIAALRDFYDAARRPRQAGERRWEDAPDVRRAGDALTED